MANKTHVRGQIFGYKELPSESGLWGVLLPRPGEKAVAHEPDAPDVIDRIDTDRLVFGNSERVGNRGFGLSFGSYVAVLVGCTLLPLFAWGMATAELALWEWCFFIVLLLSFFGGPVLWAYVSARASLRPPVLISRKLRKVYMWHDRLKQWVGLDYDRLTPVTFVHRAITTSGAFTVYVLILCQLKPGSRQIEYSVAPAVAQTRPEGCGQMWEFIRRYMDGPPHALPAVRLLPSGSTHPKAWMARSDRAVFPGQIDDQHRINRDLFSMAVVWFWGSVGYWWERAAGWIERTAPRRPLPPELQASEAAASANPYRIIPPSAIEQQAQAGTLPYMRRRWFICGVVSTLIWGGLFSLLAASVWLMEGTPTSRGLTKPLTSAVAKP